MNCFDASYTFNNMEKELRIRLLKQIGQNIAQARRAKNIERKDLACKLNISHQAISNLENGHSDICISRLIEISIILGASFDNLLDTGPVSNCQFSTTNNRIDGQTYQSGSSSFQAPDQQLAGLIEPLKQIVVTLQEALNSGKV